MAGSESDVYIVLEETDDGYNVGGTDVHSVHRTFNGAFESVYRAVIENGWLERHLTSVSASARASLTNDEFDERGKQRRDMIRRASLGGNSVTFQFDEATCEIEGEVTYSVRRQGLQG